MSIKRKVLLGVVAVVTTLMLLFLPHFWKIDDGAAFDITYNWAFAPARYAGVVDKGHSAINGGGIEWNLVAFQLLVVLFITVIAWTLVDDRKTNATSR